MQDNLFSSITENEKFVAKYRLAPPDLSASESTSTYSPKQRHQDTNKANQPKSIPKSVLQESAVEIPKYRICIDSVDRSTELSVLKSAFIVYRIRFTRMSDLQSHATWKRYKEITAWYSQVKTTLELFLCFQYFTLSMVSSSS